ncbi:serine/threonine-protein kinase N1 [Striga asiatica]|uniref:Serine/threonine-protein kinase N1 n=1 Tax=Striga asiatica TaxID=4170 RepID=A0A5A7PMA0_STRAF|nr:serine/threonine-protein kinase N1 [Striga asiatica]
MYYIIYTRLILKSNSNPFSPARGPFIKGREPRKAKQAINPRYTFKGRPLLILSSREALSQTPLRLTDSLGVNRLLLIDSGHYLTRFFCRNFILCSRNKQTTAQSSVFEVGYLSRHARVAQSTRARAAVPWLGAEATMFTASLLDSTSQTCLLPEITFRDPLWRRKPEDHKNFFRNLCELFRFAYPISGENYEFVLLCNMVKSPNARAMAKPGESLFGSHTRATSGSSCNANTLPLHFWILAASPDIRTP